MPKRYFDDIDDGAPGEDDARYAGPTYNTMTAMPQAGPSNHQHQHHHHVQQPQPQIPPSVIHGISGRDEIQHGSAGHVAFDPSAFASIGFSVTPPGVQVSAPSVPSVPAIPPPPAGATDPSASPVLAATITDPVAQSQSSNSDVGTSQQQPQRQQRRPRGILPPDAPAHSIMDDDEETYTYTLTDEIRETLFRAVHGRRLNTMQPIYQLPCDEDEIKRQEYFHKMMYIVMGDKNWVGPIEEVLSAPSDRKRRILDIGCGSGIWAIQVADDFPEVEVVGCDLAPIQPDMVPPNLDFELFDAQLNPYPNEYFDVVHARGVHTGIRNYSLFLEEIARILAPGGLVILVESEIRALTEGKTPIDAGPRGGAPGWHAFWEQYRRCLAGNHIDTTVPTRLGALLRATNAFDDVVAQEATLPVGFWPKDDNILAVGEHAWMDHDRFIPGVRPLFLSYGLSEFRVKILVEDAQQDMYYPLTRPYTCVHVSHARKKVSWAAPRRRSRRLR